MKCFATGCCCGQRCPWASRCRACRRGWRARCRSFTCSGENLLLLLLPPAPAFRPPSTPPHAAGCPVPSLRSQRTDQNAQPSEIDAVRMACKKLLHHTKDGGACAMLASMLGVHDAGRLPACIDAMRCGVRLRCVQTSSLRSCAPPPPWCATTGSTSQSG